MRGWGRRNVNSLTKSRATSPDREQKEGEGAGWDLIGPLRDTNPIELSSAISMARDGANRCNLAWGWREGARGRRCYGREGGRNVHVTKKEREYKGQAEEKERRWWK